MTELLFSVFHPSLPPLLAALADTSPMRRLRTVGMNCGCEYTAFPRFAGGGAYTRWEHSLGVGLIVWHFTRDPAQAAAGLLHDVATPTFAHVVDFLRGDALTQETTEAGTPETIRDSAPLMALLREWGLKLEQVADYHIYPIADNDSPRLSADRLEYTLGNSLRWGFLDREQINALYADLRVGKNERGDPELVFGRREPALAFARAALACSRVYVSDEDRYAMQRLSELLALALRQGILTEADLSGTEPSLIEKLEASALSGEWRAFRALSRTRRAEAPEGPEPWRQIRAKKRFIDPLVAGQGRCSALDPALGREIAAFLAEPQSEWLLGW